MYHIFLLYAFICCTTSMAMDSLAILPDDVITHYILPYLGSPTYTSISEPTEKDMWEIIAQHKNKNVCALYLVNKKYANLISTYYKKLSEELEKKSKIHLEKHFTLENLFDAIKPYHETETFSYKDRVIRHAYIGVDYSSADKIMSFKIIYDTKYASFNKALKTFQSVKAAFEGINPAYFIKNFKQAKKCSATLTANTIDDKVKNSIEFLKIAAIPEDQQRLAAIYQYFNIIKNNIIEPTTIKLCGTGQGDNPRFDNSSPVTEFCISFDIENSTISFCECIEFCKAMHTLFPIAHSKK